MTIGLANRNPETTWAGGDIIEMEDWSKAFQLEGHDVEWVYHDDKEVKDVDVLWLFNLGWEFSNEILKKYSGKVPIVLRTIFFTHEVGKNVVFNEELADMVDLFCVYSFKENFVLQNTLGLELPDDKIWEFVNGTSEFWKDQVDWSDREGAITVVTKRQWRKRSERLIGAFFESDKRLTVVGKGFEELEAPENIRCVGYLDREELREEYNKHKVVYAVGNPDPFSNTIKEGINCGCNVVYSEIGSYCDWGTEKGCVSTVNREGFDTVAGFPFIEEQLSDYRMLTYREQVPEVINQFQKL
jgi:hypothetical protein